MIRDLENEFIFHKRLYKGDYGVVYLVAHKTNTQLLHLTVLDSDLVKSMLAPMDFLRKIKEVSGTSNSVISKVYTYGRCNDSYYYTWEFFEGESLYNFIKNNGRLDELNALKIIRDIASALNIAEEQFNIHHFTLNPRNIFLTLKGKIKLVEFGFFDCLLDEPSVFANGFSTWRLNYTRADLFYEPYNLNADADIYSLGAILYYLLVGQRPFFDAETPHDIMDTTLVIPDDIKEILHSETRSFINRMMSKASDDSVSSWGLLNPRISYLYKYIEHKLERKISLEKLIDDYTKLNTGILTEQTLTGSTTKIMHTIDPNLQDCNGAKSKADLMERIKRLKKRRMKQKQTVKRASRPNSKVALLVVIPVIVFLSVLFYAVISNS